MAAFVVLLVNQAEQEVEGAAKIKAAPGQLRRVLPLTKHPPAILQQQWANPVRFPLLREICRTSSSARNVGAANALLSVAGIGDSSQPALQSHGAFGLFSAHCSHT